MHNGDYCQSSVLVVHYYFVREYLLHLPCKKRKAPGVFSQKEKAGVSADCREERALLCAAAVPARRLENARHYLPKTGKQLGCTASSD